MKQCTLFLCLLCYPRLSSARTPDGAIPTLEEGHGRRAEPRGVQCQGGLVYIHTVIAGRALIYHRDERNTC